MNNQPANPPASSDYAQWQAEESERLNALAATARKLGIIIPTGCGQPPALNPDGSLAKAPDAPQSKQ